MEQELNRWYKKLWETKGARFIAASRLELHEKWSTIAISLISVYIISLNLLVLFPEDKRLPILSGVNITYSTICLSVLILAISLIISSRNYRLRADKFHECGRRIDEIYDKICFWINSKEQPSKYEIEKISEAYLNFLDKYENHTRLDYLLLKANNISDYDIKNKNWFWVRIKSIYYLQTVGIYVLAISMPLIILTLI